MSGRVFPNGLDSCAPPSITAVMSSAERQAKQVYDEKQCSEKHAECGCGDHPGADHLDYGLGSDREQQERYVGNHRALSVQQVAAASCGRRQAATLHLYARLGGQIFARLSTLALPVLRYSTCKRVPRALVRRTINRLRGLNPEIRR